MDTNDDIRRMRYEDRRRCLHPHPHDPDYDGPEPLTCDICGDECHKDDFMETWARFNGDSSNKIMKADWDSESFWPRCFKCAGLGLCECGEVVKTDELAQHGGKCAVCEAMNKEAK